MRNYLSKIFRTTLILLILTLQSYAQGSKPEWLVIYWMPYDNNLSNMSDTIVSMIDQSIVSDNVMATIQADLAGEGGMTRMTILEKTITRTQVQNDNSKSGQAFSNYLDWVSNNYEAKNYALVFLDHGGKLNEIGLDTYPDKGYLRIDSARMAIERFNEKTKTPLELLFMQVCSKGSVESVYEFSGVSKYSMFSQTLLGAPNYYYPGVFSSLSNKHEIEDGLALAARIAQSERSDMFQSYVVTDNSKFKSFKKTLNSIINSMEQNEYSVSYYDNLPLTYAGENYWDLEEFLELIDREKTLNLVNFMDNELIAMLLINDKDSTMTDYCGLSMLAMTDNYLEMVKHYSHLKFFQQFYMEALFRRIRFIKER